MDMHNPAFILLYGKDKKLLRLRAMVLELGDNEVSLTTGAELARAILATSRVDVLVLCHTLDPTEREQLVAEVMVDYPMTKLLVLGTGAGGWARTEGALALATSDGPGQLLRTVDSMLSRTIH